MIMKEISNTKISLALVLLLFLSACSNNTFTLTTDIAGVPGDCKAIDPVPEQIYSMQPILDEAIKSGKEYDNQNVLVLFDVDNTLLASKNLLGSDQWFTWREDVLKEDDEMSNFGCLLKAQRILFERGSMRTTSSDVVRVVKSLQKQGFKVAVLTSRGPEMQSVTLRDLYKAGLEFSESSPIGWFEDSSNRPIRYEYGVFLTSGLNKGVMADLLIRKTGLARSVKKVIFVDDKTKHVCRVQKAMENSGKKVSSFHYPLEDKYVAPVVNRDEETLNMLRSDWSSFYDDLSCNSAYCEKALSQCSTAWQKYKN